MKEKFIYVFKYNDDNIFAVKTKLNKDKDISNIKIYKINSYKEFSNYDGYYDNYNKELTFHIYDLSSDKILKLLNEINKDKDYELCCEEHVATISDLCWYEKYAIHFNQSPGRWLGADYGIYFNVILAIRLKLLLEYSRLDSFSLECMQPNFTIFNNKTFEFEQVEVEDWEKIKKDLLNY